MNIKVHNYSTSNIVFVYDLKLLIIYVDNAGGPEEKKAKLTTGTEYVKAPAHVVDKPRLTFPLLEQVVEISEEEKELLKQRLYCESVSMMYKFQKLFSATIKSLKERKVTVKDLLNHIGCLVAIKPVYEDSKLGQLRRELPNVETIDDVMEIVREYSSFFNYQILQNIIDNLGGEKDRKKSSHIFTGVCRVCKA